MMAALIGMMYCTPSRPSGISRLSAASGPYAAELNASRPKIGMPAPGPICSARSSLVLIGLPTTKSRMFITELSPTKQLYGENKGPYQPRAQERQFTTQRNDGRAFQHHGPQRIDRCGERQRMNNRLHNVWKTPRRKKHAAENPHG